MLRKILHAVHFRLVHKPGETKINFDNIAFLEGQLVCVYKLRKKRNLFLINTPRLN